MSFVIQCVDMPGINREPEPRNYGGMYLARYEPEAYDGHGLAEWTEDPRKAIRFATAADAFSAWRATPITRPVRDDGAPNRPLSAYSIAVLEHQD